MTERQLTFASLIDEPIGAEPPSPQEQAFNKLNRLKCGALFMEMGTGKTKVALDLVESRESGFYSLDLPGIIEKRDRGGAAEVAS